MSDLVQAPLSENSGSRVELRAELERVLRRGRAGENIEPLLEALQETAERERRDLELADLCADLLGTNSVEELPEAARLEVYLHTAWLCGDHDAHEAATLQAATSALDLAPADERALALAEPLLLEDEQYSELANRYAVAATSAGNETRARQLLERALHMLKDIPAAAPAVLGLTERLAQLSVLRESDDALLHILRSATASEGEAALVKLGERWLADGRARVGLDQLPSEVDRFEGEAALDVLERLCDHAEDAVRLEQVLARRLTLERTPLGKARALERLAAFHQDVQRDEARATAGFCAAAEAYLEAGELDDAERAYERVLDVAAEHTRAASSLVSLRAKAGNFAAAAEAFGVLLRATDDNRRVTELLLSIADDAARAGAADEFAELADNVSWRLAGEQRELSARLARATAQLFTQADRYDEAAELYRRLIADGATSEDLDAYQALIDAHPGSEWRRSQQRWLFEWQEHHSSDRPSILLCWARFEEQELGDPEAALSVLERAAQVAPDHPEIWERLARLRLSEGDGDGGLVAASQLRRLGRDVDDALLGLLLEHDPAARWALDRVKLTLSAEQRWPELFELYERAIAATGDLAERARLLDEAAIAARDVVQDRKRAIRYWESYVELVGAAPRIDSALERLYEQTHEKAALIAHLERRLATLPDAERAPLVLRLAQLSLDTGAFGAALDAIERLGGAANHEGVALLERLVQQSAERWSDPSERAAGRRAAALLREHYAQASQPAERARLLRVELDRELRSDERRELLGELSITCERELDDLPGAHAAARELFLLSLAERDRKRLEKLTKKLNRWGELCATYAGAARSAREPEQRRKLLRLATDVALTRTGDSPLAMRLLRELFEIEPERAVEVFERLELDGGDTPEAFDALCQLLHEARRFDELSCVLTRATETRPTPALFSRLGRLRADELDDLAGAIEAHLAASDVRAAAEVFLRRPSVFGDAPSKVSGLAERLVGVGLPEGAVRVLRHQLAHYGAHYPSERKLLQLELVKVLEEAGDASAAQGELAEAAKRYPTDAEVQLTSARAAVAREDWDKAEQYYRSLLLLLHGASGAGASRAQVYVELAAIKLRRGDAAAASELIDSGFELALGDAGELTALAQALVRYEQREAAERAIGELLSLTTDVAGAARSLSALAELCAQSHQPSPLVLERAARAAERALGHVAEPAERSSLLAACVSLLPLPEAERLLSDRAGELTDSDATRARLQLGRRLLEHGGERERARALELLEGLGSHPAAPIAVWELLARAYEAEARPDKLYDAVQAWLEREPESQVLLSRALALELGRSDAARALELFDRHARLGAVPAPELSRGLCQLCLKVGKVERAVALLGAEAERERQPQKRAALFVEAAELLLAQGEHEQAGELAARAQALDPGAADAVWIAAQLALSRGHRGPALQLLSAHLDGKERRRGKPLARVLRLAADLRLENDELAEALPLLTEAHQLDKTDLDTALLLGLLAIDLDRLETAASALRVLIAQRELGAREGAAARSLNLAQGYFQLARIEHHHGKKTNAKRMALRALEENPELGAAGQLLEQLGMH